MIHILVVDDDAELNKTVCSCLNSSGFEFAAIVRGLGYKAVLL